MMNFLSTLLQVSQDTIRSIGELVQSSSNTIFWISAVLGTTFFLLRVLMSLFGGGFGEDDIDVDVDSFEDGDAHHGNGLFKFFTMHSVSGFLMMFGWAGLACSVQCTLSAGYSFLIALGCGLAMLITTVLIMRGALFFEGPGSVFSSKKTIGLIGTVYQRIPAHGQGKIHIVVNTSTRELLAQSYTKKDIESFTLIKVVKAIDHEVVEVIALPEELA